MNFRKKLLNTVKNPVYLKSGFIFLAAAVLFAAVYLFDNSRKIAVNEDGEKILKRSSQAGKEESLELQVKAGDMEEDFNVTVSGQGYESMEIQKKLEEAGSDLEQMILGGNDNPDDVREDLNLITEIADTGISVTWELDNYEVMDITGRLNQNNLKEDGTLVKLTAVLTYEEEKTIHEFYVRVYPPRLNQSEKLLREIREQVQKAEEETKTQPYLTLPQEVNGVEIDWKYAKNSRAFAILILGLGGACMVCVSDKQRRREEEKRKAGEMKRDYPQIINKFNLYIGAGMTVRKAWFRIAEDYEREKSKTGEKPAYEEMVYTMHQIQGGAAEGECYENYGIRCKVPVYRKFGTMLSQNLRKGSKGLSGLLQREAQEAFEERKHMAKKLGEEAGTKLMIPMFMMLIIVFVIVIVPAFFSIQI